MLSGSTFRKVFFMSWDGARCIKLGCNPRSQSRSNSGWTRFLVHMGVHVLPGFRLSSLVTQFKLQFGRSLHVSELPAQSYHEAFEERLHDGAIEAETLAHVVSIAEEQKQPKSECTWALLSTLQIASDTCHQCLPTRKHFGRNIVS